MAKHPGRIRYGGALYVRAKSKCPTGMTWDKKLKRCRQKMKRKSKTKSGFKQPHKTLTFHKKK